MLTTTPERHIALSGGCNFRDLGGYTAADGASVKWRKLFRSGVLDRLTEADQAALASLKLGAIVDFRTSNERVLRPSRPIAGARIWSREYGSSNADHNQPLGHIPPAKLRRQMFMAYESMLDEQADGYRVLMQTLADASEPVLFHCTGGKDRTGIGAALVLELLGVDRDQIAADYVLTNTCLARDAAVIDSVGHAYPREMRVADPDYLNAMFVRLDAEFGGASGYLRHLGLPDDLAPRIRENLLA